MISTAPTNAPSVMLSFKNIQLSTDATSGLSAQKALVISADILLCATGCMVEAGLGCTLLNQLEVEAWNGNVAMLHTTPEICFEIGVLYSQEDMLTYAAKSFLKSLIYECEH